MLHSTADDTELVIPSIEPALCSYPRRLQVYPKTKVHTHPFFELAFALEDGAEWEFPRRGERIRLPKDFWILTPPDVPHAERFTHRRNPLLGWIGFTIDADSTVGRRLVARAFKAHRCFPGIDHPKTILEEILGEQEHAFDHWKLKRRLALQRMVVCLLRNPNAEQPPHPAGLDRVIPHLTNNLPTYLDNAAYFLAEQFNRPVAVSEVANYYRVSVAHFTRLFKKRFKMSPKAFQMEARYEQVKRLLEQGNQDQLSIALECGFHDASHLSRYFKKRSGTTPESYRKGILSHEKINQQTTMR